VIQNGRIVGVRARPSRGVGPGKVLFTRKGSQLRVLDPIQSGVENIRRIIRESDLNRVGLALLDLAESHPDELRGVIDVLDKKGKHVVKVSAKDVKAMKELKKVLNAQGNPVGDEEVKNLVMMMNRERLQKGSDRLIVYRDGERHTLRVRSDLADAIQSLSPENAHWLVKMIALPTQTLKKGIVLQPLFPPLAGLKDLLEATMRTKYGLAPWHWFKGFADSMADTDFGKMLGFTPSQYLKEFRASGGAFAALSGVEVRDVRSTMRYLLDLNAKSPILHPIELLKRYAKPFEEAARIAEFRLARQAGKSVTEAAIAARNITIDFNQAGQSMQALNMMTPFLNPAIQAIATDARALRSNPGKILMIGSALALGSWMLNAANQNDQELKDLRRTPFGRLFWWFRLPNGEIGKLPKPYFWGQVFATSAEVAYDQMEGEDPGAIKDWGEAMVQSLWGVGGPALAQMYIGIRSNRHPFLDQPIESEELGGLEPPYRVLPSTSAVAAATGELFNVSPVKVDFVISTAFGSLGRDVLTATSLVRRAKMQAPEPVSADLPVIGRLFGRFPSGNVEPVRTFYDVAKRVETVANTVNFLGEQRPTELRAYVEKNYHDVALATYYAGVRANMSEVREAIKTFTIADLDPATKRQYIEGLKKALIQLARQANEMDRRVREVPVPELVEPR
jgi:hypothetical protein